MRLSVYCAAMMACAGFGRAAPAAAQRTGTGGIHGRVLNEASKTPIAGATINITAPGSGVSLARAAAGADGAFRVQSLRAGKYHVQIRALGYKPWDAAAIDVGATSVDLGTINLVAAPLALQSIAVTEKQQDVQLAPDRNSYVVRDMPTTKGGNALDVLRNVPAVDVDIDNIVSLRGNSGVTVQINGRPSPMKPAQLGDFLAQLSADMVDKVEVIPNPSARDDPTGVAGIINIVLKQEADAGTSGGLTATWATTGQVNVGGSVGYQKGPLSFYGSYGFFRRNEPRTESIVRDNLYVVPVTYLQESGLRTQTQHGHTLSGSGAYLAGKHDEFALDAVFTTRVENESYGLQYQYLNTARTLTGASDRITTGSNDRYNIDATLGFKHTFPEKGHKLSSEIRFNRQQEGGPNLVTAHTLPLLGTDAGTVSDLENQTAWERPNESSFKADYLHPLPGLMRLETGYKTSLQHFNTTLDTHVFDSTAGIYRPDSTRISDFTYRQFVNAAYGVLSAVKGHFQLQGGARVERAETQFHLNTSNATYPNAYNSVFPSALVAYNIDAAYQVKVSYSTRIRRPDDTDVLDPTLHFADPLNVSRGNPYLKPEYIRALELGLQRTVDKTTLQLTPFWRHSIDAVRSLRTIDSSGVATRAYANVASTDGYGGDATAAISGHRLSGFLGASAYKTISNAGSLTGLSVNTFGWRARTNASFRVSSSLDIQSLVSYQAPMNVEQGRTSSRTQVNIAARQKLMQDQLSLTVRVIDPFNMSHETNTTIDPRFYQVSDRSRAIRGVLLSAAWSFGKPDKQEKVDLVSDP